MKNGDYFKGIFKNSININNPNHDEIKVITENNYGVEFGYYDNFWYYLKDGILKYHTNIPAECKNLITYQDFENWILDKQSPEIIYEVY